MSDLYVKRQSIHSQIRRAEIEDYIRKSRQHLYYTTHNEPLEQDLTPQELDQLYDQLEHCNYQAESLLDFIKTVMARRTSSLNQPLLFVRLKHILEFISDKEEAAIARDMARKLCLRVVAEAVELPAFLEPCFKELFALIADSDT
jgi:hypothetical protein